MANLESCLAGDAKRPNQQVKKKSAEGAAEEVSTVFIHLDG
jgi:hypothetical protein